MRRTKKALCILALIVAGLFALAVWMLGKTDSESIAESEEEATAAGRGMTIPDLLEAESVRLALEGKNTRFRFWGKVVDQDGEALPNVKVTATVRRWELYGLSAVGRFKEYEVLTDAAGNFKILDAHGDLLQVESLAKSGYRQMPVDLRAFGFGPETFEKRDPVPDSPVVFRMLNTQIGASEGVRGFAYEGPIRVDGTPILIDVLRSVSVQGTDELGHIRLRLTRSEDRSSAGDPASGWKLRVEMVDGGLRLVGSMQAYLHHTDLFLMYKAPEDGYFSEKEMVLPGTGIGTSKRIAFTFFFRLNAGVYGKAGVYVNLNTASETTRFQIKGTWNSTGSPLLSEKELLPE